VQKANPQGENLFLYFAEQNKINLNATLQGQRR
jgi:hypothetical protein